MAEEQDLVGECVCKEAMLLELRLLLCLAGAKESSSLWALLYLFFNSPDFVQVLCSWDIEMWRMGHSSTELISSVTSQTIWKCAGKGVTGPTTVQCDQCLHDLFCLSLLRYCIIGLQLWGTNLLNKSSLSGVKVKTLLLIDGMATFNLNFYPGKEKAKFEKFYTFSTAYFNWWPCNSLERHNYGLTQT